jgi:energy-coupling factor transporter transmembrane protein EcfT
LTLSLFGATLRVGVRPSHDGLPHVPLQAWAGTWGTNPTLTLNGWNISLAGLVLPLVIALVLLRVVRVADVPRNALWMVTVSLPINLLLVLFQSSEGFTGGRVHLLTLVPALMLWGVLRWVWGWPSRLSGQQQDAPYPAEALPDGHAACGCVRQYADGAPVRLFSPARPAMDCGGAG